MPEGLVFRVEVRVGGVGGGEVGSQSLRRRAVWGETLRSAEQEREQRP